MEIDGDGDITFEDREEEKGWMFEMRKGVCESEGHRENGSLSV